MQQKIRNEIARLEYLLIFFRETNRSKKDATEKAFIIIHEKCYQESVEFLYDLLRETDKEWDGKIFFDEPQYNCFKIKLEF